MALTNWDILTIVNTVLNKDLEGNAISTDEAETLINAQSQIMFAEKLGIPNEYARNVPLARRGVGVTRKVSQELRPFLKKATKAVTGGALTFTEDIGYLLSVEPETISGRGVDIIEPDELADRIGSEVVSPSVDDPVMLWETNTTAIIYPTSITQVTVRYYEFPNNAVIATTTNSTTLREEYDATNSTELQWNDEQKVELAYRILRDAGVNIERQDVVALGERITQNE